MKYLYLFYCNERSSILGFMRTLLFIYLLTYLLTYSMVQSPSWEANWFAASQEIPRISRNPNVHYRTRKRPPPVSILGQPNPVHIPTSHLLEIHPNIIHPSTPRLLSGLFFPSGFPSKTLYTPLSLYVILKKWNSLKYLSHTLVVQTETCSIVGQ